ncbi:16435_t:CDS:2, partial [Cetraspora pellucida]
IGCVNTIQMIIGFGFDFLRITSGRTSLTQSTGGEKRSALNEYWYNRRKGYQEMVDKLYVKYMERLHGNISEYDENAIAANYGPYDMNTAQIQ